MKRNITLAEECKECYIATTYDLAIAKAACQLQDTIQPKYDNILVCFGAFHIMFRYLSAIGYLIDSSGAGHILMESGALTKGSLNAGSIRSTLQPEFSSSHIEADTMLVYHLNMISESSPKQNVVVRATDTDIMIILLYHVPNFKLNVWMDLGHSSDNTRRYVHITELARHLGPVFCKALPGYHALTGCDYTAAFLGKGKVNPLKKAEKNSLFLESLGKL